MNVDGFNLRLKYYCAHCGDFEPQVLKMDASCLSDPNKYMTDIFCKHMHICENLVNRFKNTDKEELPIE